jgi:DNA-binding CsgD family transcriptional regulator
MPAGNGFTLTGAGVRAGLRGRDHDLAMLADLLERTRAGSGGGWEIAGDAGLGKTALLAAAAASADGFRITRIRGVTREKALPGAGLNQLLKPLAEHSGPLPPALAALTCDLSDRNRKSSLPDAFSLYATLTQLLTEIGRATPLLCCVDDLQWLDPLSRDGLLFCARRLTDEPVVLLLAGRPQASGDFPSLTLDPLTDEASRRLLEDRIPDGLPQDVSAELVSLASGNPLALGELADSLTAGHLAGTEPAPSALPRDSRLRAHFRRRFDALSPNAQRLICLAVADENIGVDTVVRAAGAAGIDLRALEEATASGLVHQDGEVIAAPSRLVRSSLYAEMPLADRHATHELLAEVLDDEQHRPQSLAHRAAIALRPDARLADELDEAASIARRSREYGTSSRAYQQAAALTPEPATKALRLVGAARDFWLAGHAQRSRTLLRQVKPLTCDPVVRGLAALLEGEIELRDGAPAVGRQSLLEAADELARKHLPLAVAALMRAAEASCLAGNYAGFFATAQRASALSRPGGPPLLRLMSDHFTGLSLVLRGHFEQARGPLRRVVEIAEALPGCAPKAWATVAALALGDDTRAQRLASQAVNAAAGDGNAVLGPWALEFLAYTALRLDHYSAAANAAVDGLRLAQVAGQHNCAVNHLSMLALIAALLGDKEATVLRLQNAADEAAARGLSRPTAMSSWSLACLDLAEDRPADAMERLRAAVTGADGSSPFVRIMATPQFIEAAVRCDERATATKTLEMFDEWACSTGNPAHLALSQRCQALLADGPEADERFREALRLHRKGERPFELAKTELFYGERLRRSRKPRDARKYLRNAWKTFQRYDATYWAGRARAELRAAGEAVDHTAPAGLDLTPQQAQISKLVAEGATNREIAAQLFLSPRTVEHHLRNIFAKLGIRSRVELTAFFR